MSHHSREDQPPSPSLSSPRTQTAKSASSSPDAHLRNDEKPLMCSPPDAVVIRLRAYEISQARRSSGEDGDADSDWRQAEREVFAARSSMR
jgi:hypothetical protein